MVAITECPRDAMQGIREFIPTGKKIEWLNLLLRVGFDVLDCGSFVSPKAVPQMQDTAEVLTGLHTNGSETKLSVIVANARGARDAARFEIIDWLGYPFSISETFQLRNTNATLKESLERVKEINAITQDAGKELLIYISMAFGNPYGDPWQPELAADWIARLNRIGIRRFSLADTVGIANPDTVFSLFETLIKSHPELSFSAHFHTRPDRWHPVMEAAWEGGCRHYEGAIKGFGGCPMAKDELTGNMPTENILTFIEEKKEQTRVNPVFFQKAVESVHQYFPLN